MGPLKRRVARRKDRSRPSRNDRLITVSSSFSGALEDTALIVQTSIVPFRSSKILISIKIKSAVFYKKKRMFSKAIELSVFLHKFDPILPFFLIFFSRLFRSGYPRKISGQWESCRGNRYGRATKGIH